MLHIDFSRLVSDIISDSSKSSIIQYGYTYWILTGLNTCFTG